MVLVRVHPAGRDQAQQMTHAAGLLRRLDQRRQHGVARERPVGHGAWRCAAGPASPRGPRRCSDGRPRNCPSGRPADRHRCRLCAGRRAGRLTTAGRSSACAPAPRRCRRAASRQPKPSRITSITGRMACSPVACVSPYRVVPAIVSIGRAEEQMDAIDRDLRQAADVRRGSWRRRDGGAGRSRHLPGRVRPPRAARWSADEPGYRLPHRVHDQGGHRHRGDADGGTGQAVARCTGRRDRAGTDAIPSFWKASTMPACRAPGRAAGPSPCAIC